MVAIRPRVAATLSAALSAALLVATLTGAARQPAVSDPVQAAFTPPGPYATTTGTVTGASGTAIYDLFYPSNYAALGFRSPIITWGNGTGSAPGKYSAFLSHLASTASPSRPLRQMTGGASFNEVFLDDVAVIRRSPPGFRRQRLEGRAHHATATSAARWAIPP